MKTISVPPILKKAGIIKQVKVNVSKVTETNASTYLIYHFCKLL